MTIEVAAVDWQSSLAAPASEPQAQANSQQLRGHDSGSARQMDSSRNWKPAVGERGQSFCEAAHREDVIGGTETTNC